MNDNVTEDQMRLRQQWLLNLPFLKQCFLLSPFQIKGHLAASSTLCLKILANIIFLVSSGSIELGRVPQTQCNVSVNLSPKNENLAFFQWFNLGNCALCRQKSTPTYQEKKEAELHTCPIFYKMCVKQVAQK